MPELPAPLRVASRGSRLALLQARLATQALRATHPTLVVELREVRTEGDERPEPLMQIAGKGVFVKEIDDRLLDGRADVAVHSAKDMPTTLHEGLVLAALLPRGPQHDVLLGPGPLAALPKGARVGTSSPRRIAQLKHQRPDLQIVPLRGNVPTRAARVGKDCDAVVLAAAGLERLGMATGHAFSLHDLPTAPGQGAIAVVARRGSSGAVLAAQVDHAPTRVAVEVERAVLRELGTGCTTPLGCSAWWQDRELRVVAELLSADGARATRLTRTLAPEGHLEQAYELGVEMARRGGEVLGRL